MNIVPVKRMYIFSLALLIFGFCHLSLRAMLLDSVEYPLFSHEMVILILGTSCSGKSTVAKVLQQRLGDCTVIKTDFLEEQIEADAGYLKIATVLPCDFDGNQYFLMKGWLVEHIRTLSAIRSHVLHGTKKPLICKLVPVNGKGVDITASFIEELQKLECSVFVILVESPLGLIFQRHCGKRFGAEVQRQEGFYEPQSILNQFLTMYKATEDDAEKVGMLIASHMELFCDVISTKQRVHLLPAFKRFMSKISEHLDTSATIPISAIYQKFDCVFHNDVSKDLHSGSDSIRNFCNAIEDVALKLKNWLVFQHAFEDDCKKR